MKTCLKSIEQQTFQDFEVIIVDGSSTDGTPNYLKKLQYPFRVLCEPDDGVYDAMNKGIVLAQGEWLYFMGCDDRLYSKMVLENIFTKTINDNVDLILGRIQYYQADMDKVLYKSKKGILKAQLNHVIWFRNITHHQATFYRVNLFRNKLFETKYPVLSDYHKNIYLSFCGANGISKNLNYSVFKEEIILKCESSTYLLFPLYFFVSLFKLVVRFLFK